MVPGLMCQRVLLLPSWLVVGVRAGSAAAGRFSFLWQVLYTLGAGGRSCWEPDLQWGQQRRWWLGKETIIKAGWRDVFVRTPAHGIGNPSQGPGS